MESQGNTTAISKSAPADRSNIDWEIMWERFGIATVVIVAWIMAIFLLDNFSNIGNITSVLRQSAFVGISAVGMTIAIISGTFDLSVGAILGLCAWVAVLVAGQFGLIPAILSALLVGMALGSVNGLLVTRLKIPAFIATLGMYFVIRGFHFILTEGAAARYNGPEFVIFGNGKLAGILPIPFAIFLICALIGAIVLNRTPFGRYVYALGSSSSASKVAGVPIRKVTMIVFILVGLFTAISGFLLGSRLYSAGPGLEPGFELTVIATVVLGGTRLSGGRGSMLGTVSAAILFATMANALNLLQADAFIQKVAVGLVLLLALSIDGIRQRLVERKG
jgi:ribose/xylose/arabinose/galactoside ABC-type transport system permease subunit